jgi:hypothetical protein
MKKYFYLLLMSITITLFTSCGSDDGDEIAESNNLIGAWGISGVEIEITINDTDFVQWMIDNLALSDDDATVIQALFQEGFEEDFTGTMTFNEDGSYSSDFDGEVETGTWTLNGSTLTLMQAGEDNVTATVVSLTGSALVIEISQTEQEDFDDDGTKETLRITIRMSLSK